MSLTSLVAITALVLVGCWQAAGQLAIWPPPCTSDPADDICTLPSCEGPLGLSGVKKRWYFNGKSCHEFDFGGFNEGNGNNFLEKSACMEMCASPKTDASASVPFAYNKKPSQRECPVQRYCAHFHKLGHRGKSCPGCRRFISQCPKLKYICPPIIRCKRFGTIKRKLSCCLPCLQYRSIKTRVGLLCANVHCPEGMYCKVKRTHGGWVSKAVCKCRTSCPKVTDKRRQVTGRDGVTYESRCHMLRKSCRTSTNLEQ